MTLVLFTSLRERTSTSIHSLAMGLALKLLTHDTRSKLHSHMTLVHSLMALAVPFTYDTRSLIYGTDRPTHLSPYGTSFKLHSHMTLTVSLTYSKFYSDMALEVSLTYGTRPSRLVLYWLFQGRDVFEGQEIKDDNVLFVFYGCDV